MTKKPKKSKKAVRDIGKTALGAGLHLLTQGIGTSNLSIGIIAADAGITPDDFKAAYPEFNDYLLDLLQRLVDEVSEESRQARKQLHGGRARLRLGIVSYLDAMLQHPALLDLSYTLRTHPRCQKITRKRLEQLMAEVSAEMKAVGVGNPAPLARLGTAMLTEAARAEYEARRPLKDFRATLTSYFPGP